MNLSSQYSLKLNHKLKIKIQKLGEAQKFAKDAFKKLDYLTEIKSSKDST
jgi:hypothetical protein